MAYKHILLAVDFDDQRVGQRAAALAQSCGARLSLVHVIDPLMVADDWGPTVWVPVAAPGMAMPPVAAPLGEEHRETIQQAYDELNRVAKQLGAETAQRKVAVAGSTREAIHEAAQDMDADLIVVGSHGRHGLSLFMVGDTAKSMLKDAPCDVLAVRLSD